MIGSFLSVVRGMKKAPESAPSALLAETVLSDCCGYWIALFRATKSGTVFVLSRPAYVFCTIPIARLPKLLIYLVFWAVS
jgi:hypothetical protein